MILRNMLCAAAALCLSLFAAKAETAEHPFFRDALYPAWSQMTPQQVETDAREGIQRAQERIDALLKITPQNATFENTFLAYQRATEELDQLLQYSYHIYTCCNTNADFIPALNKVMPGINSCRNRLQQLPRIQQLLRNYAKSPQARKLSKSQQRLMQRTLDALPVPLTPDMEKKRVQMQQELARLITAYEQNLSKINESWYYVFKDRKQLAGVPPHTVQAMEDAAKAGGFCTKDTPAWLITAKSPALSSVLRHCTVEATRQKCYQALKSPGYTRSGDNGPIVMRIMQLRQEIAKYNGYKSHADYKLHDRMMGSGNNALAMVDRMLERFTPVAEARNAELLQAASIHYEYDADTIKPWDTEFLKNKKEQPPFNTAQLRSYFEYENTLQGILTHSAQLFGLTIKELPTVYLTPGQQCTPGKIEVWAPGVRIFTVHDATDGTHYGSFYLDAYTRKGKTTGARCQMLRVGTPSPQGNVGEPHLAAMMFELQAPAKGAPHLLSHLEVRMLFHEIGHILHQMLGHGELREDAAIHQALDFIELPAHLHENRAWEPQVLCSFARHYKTGAPLPMQLAQQLAAARYDAGVNESMLNNLLIAKLDLEIHTHYYKKFHGKSLDAATQAILGTWLPPTAEPQPSPLRNLSHCISVGYDANFYAYAAADIMAADVYEVFRQHGINNSAIGRSYRKAILEPGNSAPAAELYRHFMGRNVSTEPYLKNTGL
ncbi:MAG: hypothetical protein IJ993_01155 [Akkermansia sp.]|nr:hypothetical protein [Akkermansia sp.]